MARILVVDDEEPIVELVKYNLEKGGHRVWSALDGVKAVEQVEALKPDLVVLDLMLPGFDGLEVCRRVRTMEYGRDIPIIILSARNSELDKVLGLEIGADDYVTKPFSPRELVARVQACLRRRLSGKDKETEDEIKVGPFTMKPERYEVYLKDQPLELTPKEFELLKQLLLHKGKVLKRDFLLDRVWGYNCGTDTRTVDVHIRYLRQKIEEDPANPQYIETVRGVGYRFRIPVGE
jgi:two-component system alkaline phosphatase synthesis response regulator PhoP